MGFFKNLFKSKKGKDNNTTKISDKKYSGLTFDSQGVIINRYSEDNAILALFSIMQLSHSWVRIIIAPKLNLFVVEKGDNITIGYKLNTEIDHSTIQELKIELRQKGYFVLYKEDFDIYEIN